MVSSRAKNTKRNIFSGLIKQFVGIFLSFAIRTIIIYTLGAEYQGLNGLFNSILQVLNLADLGFSTAVIFILYKPIAEKDNASICSIINYLKKIYFYIGLIILISGLLLLPFLNYLISGDIPNDVNLYILFLIYLFNTAISYMLFAYKSALFTAMQRQDKINNIYTISSIIIKACQFILLLLFKNYYIYIIVLPLGTILNNILIQKISKKMFPLIIPSGTINNQTKKIISKQIKAIFIGKISDVARNSFDNIVLSILFGLVIVAIYDNYYYIYASLYGIMGIIIHGIQASVGDSIVTESIEKNYEDLKKFNFIFMWITGWCSICMFCLYQHFMLIWMKNDIDLLLSNTNMTLFCVYFYAINMTYVRSMYLDGNGLFYECKKWFILEAIANLLLNFILGYLFGIIGILIATIITIFLLNFITRTNIVFKYYFKRTPKEFYLSHLKYFLVTLFAGIITNIMCNMITNNGLTELFVKAVICLVVPNTIFLLIYFRSKQYKVALSFIKKLIKNK